MEILLIEDDDDMRSLLKNILKQRGHHVADYSTGESGLEAYQAGAFSMILLDWLLPGMDGLELCKKIRNSSSGTNSIIIMITVRTEPGDLEKVLEAGADDYIAKPFELELLDIRLSIAENRVYNNNLRKRAIKEKDKAETALNNSRSMMQLVIDSIPTLVFWKDIYGRFLGCNNKFAEYADLQSSDSIIGKTDKDMPWNENFTDLLTEDQEVLRSGEPLLEVEKHHTDKNDKEHWLLISKAPLTDAFDNIIGILGLHQNITESKLAYENTKEALKIAEQAKQELILNNLKLEAILNASPDGVLVVDLAGNITCCSEKFLELWRIPESISASNDTDKLTAFILKQLTSPEIFFAKITSQLANTEKKLHDILELKNGCVYERHSQLQYNKGEIIGCVWSFHDITQSELDKRSILNTKNDAVNANKMKSDFISRMSHELRTPLNAILGFSKLFEYDKALNKHQKSNANEIYLAGEHLLSLIDEVLDLTKIEAGYVELSIEPVSLSSLMSECLTLIAPLAASHNIRLDIQTPQFDDIFINADYTRLKQVILNLLSNAVKYNQPNGAVSVKATSSTDGILRLEITDTGPGMSEEKMSQLYQPFNRLGAEMSEVEGTGIGLVITRQLTELMNGKLGIDSTPGVGSTFWVELETCDSSVIANIATINKQNKGNKTSNPFTPDMAHILIAEDNLTNQEVLSQQLRVLGYKADFANDGVEALNMWQENSYHLLLTDIHMPKMDGYELVKNIRKLENNKNTHIPIIAITANAMHGESRQCIDAGMDAYVSKPISLDDIQKVIEHWLEKSIDSTEESLFTSKMNTSDVVASHEKITPIDFNAITSLVGNDPAILNRLLKSFKESSPEIIAAINYSLDKRDAEGIASNAHKLKSSANAVGANDLSETCNTLEAASRNTEWDTINKLHPELILQFDTIRAYINNRFRLH